MRPLIAALIVLAVGAIVLFSAGSSRAQTDAPPLEWTVWQLTSLPDGTTIDAKDRSRYAFQLLNDGTVAIQADCNRAKGVWSASGDDSSGDLDIRIAFSMLAQCSSSTSQGFPFLLALDEATDYSIDADTLELARPDGRKTVLTKATS
jgi:heat shock protein HslJ